MKAKCWNCEEYFEYDLDEEWNQYVSICMSQSYDYKKEWDTKPEEPWKRVYCSCCAQKCKEEAEETKRIYISTKTKMLLERAITFLERQKIGIYEYEEAIKAVSEYAEEKPEKFDSSYEMIAAIILIHNRVETKLQWKVDKYTVDFCLPELKCILEIDGERHEHRHLYDSNRDIKLRQILGAEWEVVRIPTQYLEKNAKMLLPAIKALKAEKQKIRNQNGGIIPAHFSKRDYAKANRIEKIARA